MASAIYNYAKVKILQGDIDFDLPINVALVTSSYTQNIDTEDFYSDITGEATNGSGYTTGGITLSSTTVILDTTDDEAAFDAADITWSSSSITARGAVMYRNTGTPASSPLIAYFDFGSDKTSANGAFTIAWNAEGILNLG